MTLTFDGTVVVPAADPDDGERTATALAAHLGESSTVILVNVIEKGGGSIDKAPMERRKEYADEIFERAREPLVDAPGTVETATLFGTDVVGTIFEAADDRDADAVVFTARKSNRLAELLTGDVARKMVKRAAIPVVALPLEQN
ncbi:universal stress protein [Natrarchaeobaculum aegyptiacum]|uniref:Universal stress protein UspA n=1 Tax=Natrarchaeobaculum aegyptiacum TaxID=745377 RepID=A0A2Z2HWA0_9EURY|nr:universal stress protein [Natrarchaeobaculum aegyptiacum]ARS91609.1 universal stress protein UspA [Natrarchaeobaculum aegyptiacum]